MATKILMPKQGVTVEACVINAWKIQEGDNVEKGDVLCEIETDKATMEVESTESGQVLKILHEEGDEVPVQTSIAIIGTSGEDISTLLNEEGLENDNSVTQNTTATEGNSKEHTSKHESISQNQVAHSESKTSTKQELDNTVRISPRAKKLAIQLGLNLEKLQGSGPRGRIIVRDVESSHNTTPTAQIEIPSAISRSQELGLQAGTTIELKGVKKVSADRLYESLHTTAQLTCHRVARLEKLLEIHKYHKSTRTETSVAISIGDLVNYVVTRTLLEFPLANAHYKDYSVKSFDTVNLGVAVDTPQGLYVPVIKNANTLSLVETARGLKDLAAKCQTGSISMDELSGGTFTVSNLGSMGIEYFTPILNAPQTALLGIGASRLLAVENDAGVVEFKPHIFLSLSFNHQAFDGMYAAKLLKQLAFNIEHIDLLFYKDVLYT